MSLLKRIWEDPVWSKVIATAILGAVAAIATYFAGWWPAFTKLATNVISFAVADTAVPNWLLSTLILCTFIVLCLLGIALWSAIFPGLGRPAYQANYREDNFFGIRWRWSYGTDGTIIHLVSFCPGCDYQVYPRDVSAYREPERLRYRCEDCGAILHEVEMPLEEIESRIIRHIHKKIRTDSWKAKNG